MAEEERYEAARKKFEQALPKTCVSCDDTREVMLARDKTSRKLVVVPFKPNGHHSPWPCPDCQKGKQ